MIEWDEPEIPNGAIQVRIWAFSLENLSLGCPKPGCKTTEDGWRIQIPG